MPRTGAAPSSASVPASAFSVSAYAGSAHGSHRADLNLPAYATAPLTLSTLALVGTLAGLERSALGYLRSVLVTPTHTDARMTAFLVTWAYEKHWLADALEAIVAAHPDHPSPRLEDGVVARLRRGWHGIGERLEPIRESVVANLIGDDVTAVHAITAALDEWIVQAAYRRLAEAAGNTQLGATLTGLLTVKARHEAFFAAQAGDRLAASAGAVRLARRRLRHTELPIGALAQRADGIHRLLNDLLTPSDLDGIDRRLDAYPGLAGLQLARKAAARAARRAGHRSPTPPPFKETPRP